MNDDFLTRWRKSPSPEFSKALYQRISQPMNEQTLNRRFMAGRLAGAFAALSLILGLTLALSPAARAQAGELLRQIGPFTFLDRSGEGPQAISQEVAPIPTAEPPAIISVETAASVVAASKLSGFQVYEPQYLPDGFNLVEGWTVMPQADGIVVASFYQDGGGHFLGMNQYRFGPEDQWDQSYGQNETVLDITVRGQEGIAINGRYMTHPIQSGTADAADLLETNWLIWVENGVAYSLFSDSVSTEGLLLIAESLK